MGKISIVKTDRGVKQGLYEAIQLIGGMESYVGRYDRYSDEFGHLIRRNLAGYSD